MTKFYNISLKFYRIVLGLIIPVYLLFYGASGHWFNLTVEHITGFVLIAGVFVLLTLHSRLKDKKSRYNISVRIMLAGVLLATLYYGFRAIWFIANFDYDESVGFMIQIISFLFPLAFVAANVVILVNLYKFSDE